MRAKVLSTTTVAAISLTILCSAAVNSAYGNSSIRGLKGVDPPVIIRHDIRDGNNSTVKTRVHRKKNWHSLSINTFENSRSFTKEEAKAYGLMIKDLGTVKKKVFDI